MKKVLLISASLFLLAGTVFCVMGIVLCVRTIALIEQTSESMAVLQKKTQEAEALVHFMNDVASSAVLSQAPKEEDRINALLTRLGSSDLSWISSEGEKPLEMMIALINTKYLLLRGSIATQDDFIQRVCDADMLGKPFRVKTEGGAVISLQEWMRQQ